MNIVTHSMRIRTRPEAETSYSQKSAVLTSLYFFSNPFLSKHCFKTSDKLSDLLDLYFTKSASIYGADSLLLEDNEGDFGTF